jgi:hypothetical protein
MVDAYTHIQEKGEVCPITGKLVKKQMSADRKVLNI